jgi:hypothetical protein
VSAYVFLYVLYALFNAILIIKKRRYFKILVCKWKSCFNKNQNYIISTMVAIYYPRILISMGATSGSGTAYPSGAPGIIPGFSGVLVTRSLCIVYALQIVVCPFVRFVLAIVLSVLFDLRILITSLVSSNSSYIYYLFISVVNVLCLSISVIRIHCIHLILIYVLNLNHFPVLKLYTLEVHPISIIKTTLNILKVRLFLYN